MNRRYAYEYTLKTCDFDAFKHLKPTALLYHLQDISTRHFESVIGKRDEGFWVIVAWDIEVYTLKVGLEKVKVITEPLFFRKFVAYRRYEVYAEDGRLIASGTSKWAYLHKTTRAPQTIPKAFSERFGIEEHVKPKAYKVVKPDAQAVIASNHHFNIVYSDIDINQHVNNVVYLRWAIDALMHLTYEDFHTKSLCGLHIRYQKEMHENSRPSVSTQMHALGQRQGVYQVVANERGETCVEISTEWA